VRRLCLIDPAGFPLPGPPLARLLGAPLLGELVFAAAGNRFLLGGLRSDLEGSRLQEYVDRYRPPMRYRGFKRALLSTIRHMPVERMAPTYEEVGRQGRPVLLIWGREDRTIPFAVSDRVRKAIPQAEFHPVAGAGHIPHYERPEVVNPLLVEFLQR
jgi:pimeloyl-ACP methyl ester carboxylesterase